MKHVLAIAGFSLALVALAAAILVGYVAGRTAQPAPVAQASLSPITHVALFMEENHSLSQTYGSAMPYLTSLANTYAVETNEHSIGLPSLPNYIALTAGNTTKSSGGSFIGTDCQPSSSCQSLSANIFSQTAGSWRVLAESMPSNCDHSNSTLYAVRHTAAPYFTNIATPCKTLDVPYTKSATPNVSGKFTLIAPNLCDDAHGSSTCSNGLGTADSWLKTVIPKILSQAQYQDGSTLVEVTFDSGGPNNTVETVFVNPRLAKRKVTLSATHYSLLRLNEEVLGLPLLGNAKTAPDLRTALGL